ncbi:MAG: hypothetical protein IJ784_00260 [Ruminiclostridium sp.]|nr:hypothetical protein [Ruminiclostridium sp.]
MRHFNYSIDKPLPDTLELGGRKYKLTLYFDRVIRFYDMMRDKESEWSDADKIDIAYSWFVASPKTATMPEKFAVVAAINDEWLSDRRKDGSRKKTRTAVNFIADSKYIYAAFRQYYGINLFEQQGKLLWWEFIAMFDSLPSECQMKEIMYIRTRDMPQYNGHNSEEIFRIQEQREYYFLDENWEEIREESENALGNLFDKLTAEAVK